MNQRELKQFLFQANLAGYAGGDEKSWVKDKDGSTTIKFSKGDWEFNDNFFGGEPFGGRTIILYKKKPVWIMLYYGWVKKGINVNPVYKVLRNALKNMPKQYPYRGPKMFREGSYVYKNRWIGEVDKFSGEERINKGKNLVYRANYFGGMVDERKGV